MAARSTRVSVRIRSASSRDSLTGISSGAATMTAPVVAGSSRISTQPGRLVPDQPHLDQLPDGLRGRELGHDVAGGRGVDHDEVVVLLPGLPDHLADGQDLLDPRGGVGHEVQRARQGPDAGHQRDLDLEAQVLLQGLLGVHRHGEEVGLDLAGLPGGGRGGEEVGQVALGVELTDEGRLAPAGGHQGQGRGDGGLADTTLAGDEDQLAVEQIDRRGHQVRRRTRSGGRPRGCRSRRRPPCPPARPPAGPAGRSAREHRCPPRAASISALTLSGSAFSSSSNSSSLGL